MHGLAARDEGYALPRHVVEARHDDDWHGQLVLREELGRGARAREHDDLCGNQPLRRVHRQFFTKSFLGDDAAILARSSGEEPSLRADKELRRENAVVVLLRYVCASDVYVRALLEDSFWSG